MTVVRPPLPTTYGGWLCHSCHKEMAKRDTPNHEWHICDKCMKGPSWVKDKEKE